MSEQLQHLIDRIRAEGVGKADADARTILEKAKADAALIEKDARAKAEALVRQAEADAATHAERGRKALEQASRDTLLTVRQTLEGLFDKVFRRQVETALTHEAFLGILRDVITAYLAQGADASALELTVPEGRAQEIREYILKTFQAEAAQGVTIRSSNEVIAGFRVTFKNGHIDHDFTPEAIAETLARLVRPDLGALLRQAAASPKSGTPAA